MSFPAFFCRMSKAGGDRMKGKREKRLFPIMHYFPKELPPLQVKTSIGDEKFPEDSLERCHLRWKRLFYGIWRAISRYDPKLTLGLLQALKQFGLAYDYSFYSQLIEQNPSDEILRRVGIFEKLAHIPNLRGKKFPWKRYDPFIAIIDYSIVLFGLREFPTRFRNPSYGIKFLKERLQEIVPRMLLVNGKEFPKDLLSKWIRLPRKELVVRLTAHLHGLSVASFRKYLIEARHKYPDYAKSWKEGLDYTNDMRPRPEMIES